MTHLKIRSGGESGAGLAILSRNLFPAQSNMPLDGIHNGREGEDQDMNCNTGTEM